jgi:hypothetical protein
MIIARFGNTWETACPFGEVKGADDWATELTDTIVRVGGAAGGFSSEGQAAGPATPLMVHKSWVLGPDLVPTTHARILYGTGEVFGAGTLWGQINGSSWQLVDLDRTLDYLLRCTLAHIESKLWALTRDEQRRWAWAKAISGRFAESVPTRLRLPVELSFYCREGLWYGEEQQGLSLTSALPSTYTAINDGNRPAFFQLQVTSAVGTLTQLVFANTTNGDIFTWTGAAAMGQLLRIDTGAWRVQRGGGNGYAGLSYGDNQSCWGQLAPGSNALTITVAGSSSWSGSLIWWDTYQ